MIVSTRWLVVGGSVALAMAFAICSDMADQSEKAALRSACDARPSQYALSSDAFQALVDEYDRVERGRQIARALGSGSNDNEGRLSSTEAAEAFQVSRASLEYRAEPMLPSPDSDIWKAELQLYIAWERLRWRCQRVLRQQGSGDL